MRQIIQVWNEPPLRTTLSDFERNLILHTLETVGWVIGGANGAAAKLGLDRTTLIKRITVGLKAAF